MPLIASRSGGGLVESPAWIRRTLRRPRDEHRLLEIREQARPHPCHRLVEAADAREPVGEGRDRRRVASFERLERSRGVGGAWRVAGEEPEPHREHRRIEIAGRRLSRLDASPGGEGIVRSHLDIDRREHRLRRRVREIGGLDHDPRSLGLRRVGASALEDPREGQPIRLEARACDQRAELPLGLLETFGGFEDERGLTARGGLGAGSPEQFVGEFRRRAGLARLKQQPREFGVRREVVRRQLHAPPQRPLDLRFVGLLGQGKQPREQEGDRRILAAAVHERKQALRERSATDLLVRSEGERPAGLGLHDLGMRCAEPRGGEIDRTAGAGLVLPDRLDREQFERRTRLAGLEERKPTRLDLLDDRNAVPTRKCGEDRQARGLVDVPRRLGERRGEQAKALLGAAGLGQLHRAKPRPVEIVRRRRFEHLEREFGLGGARFDRGLRQSRDERCRKLPRGLEGGQRAIDERDVALALADLREQHRDARIALASLEDHAEEVHKRHRGHRGQPQVVQRSARRLVVRPDAHERDDHRKLVAVAAQLLARDLDRGTGGARGFERDRQKQTRADPRASLGIVGDAEVLDGEIELGFTEAAFAAKEAQQALAGADLDRRVDRGDRRGRIRIGRRETHRLGPGPGGATLERRRQRCCLLERRNRLIEGRIGEAGGGKPQPPSKQGLAVATDDVLAAIEFTLGQFETSRPPVAADDVVDEAFLVLGREHRLFEVDRRLGGLAASIERVGDRSGGFEIRDRQPSGGLRDGDGGIALALPHQEIGDHRLPRGLERSGQLPAADPLERRVDVEVLRREQRDAGPQRLDVRVLGGEQSVRETLGLVGAATRGGDLHLDGEGLRIVSANPDHLIGLAFGFGGEAGHRVEAHELLRRFEILRIEFGDHLADADRGEDVPAVLERHRLPRLGECFEDLAILAGEVEDRAEMLDRALRIACFAGLESLRPFACDPRGATPLLGDEEPRDDEAEKGDHAAEDQQAAMARREGNNRSGARLLGHGANIMEGDLAPAPARTSTREKTPSVADGVSRWRG